MTTAHQGSKLAGQPGVRLGIELIRRNNPLRPVWAELQATNGRAVFQPFFQDRVLTSVDGMEAGNRLLMALNSQRIAPEVAYHSIIANRRREVPLDKMSDGLVSYRSAHLDGAASEHIVTATHTCEADPQVIAEVRRILMVHLSERKGTPQTLEHENSHGKNAKEDQIFPHGAELVNRGVVERVARLAVALSAHLTQFLKPRMAELHLGSLFACSASQHALA